MDIIQYDLEPGITLYYRRPEIGQINTIMFTDKELNNVYKRNGSVILFSMKDDIYGITKYPGSYESEKVIS